MVNNVYKFRRIKWEDPEEKMKVLPEDLQRQSWLQSLTAPQFLLVVAVVTPFVFVLMLTVRALSS